MGTTNLWTNGKVIEKYCNCSFCYNKIKTGDWKLVVIHLIPGKQSCYHSTSLMCLCKPLILLDIEPRDKRIDPDFWQIKCLETRKRVWSRYNLLIIIRTITFVRPIYNSAQSQSQTCFKIFVEKVLLFWPTAWLILIHDILNQY